MEGRLRQQKEVICKRCERSTCGECGFQRHEGKTCEDSEKAIFGLIYHKCPKCQTRVEKN